MYNIRSIKCITNKESSLMKREKILITGASGYLGKHLIALFSSNGFEVIALYRSKSKCSNLPTNENVKTYFLEEITLQDIFLENSIDIIIHTATLYGRCNEPLVEIIRSNVEFPVEVLSLAIENNVKLFINTDTILVKNISPYSMTKSHFSDYLSMFADKIKCINLRLDHFYGPNDNPVKFVAWLIKEFRNNVDELDLTEGSQLRDFVYIDDVVSAYHCIVKNMDEMQIGTIMNFEVGTNIKTSIKDFVLQLKKLMQNTKTQLNFGAIAYRKNEVLDYEVDSSSLIRLGWKPQYQIKDGLKKLIEIERGNK